MVQLITWRQLVERSTISLSGLKRLEKTDPDFPKKIIISRARVAFTEAAADEWLEKLLERSPTIEGRS